MADSVTRVNPGSGVRFRANYKTCEGVLVTRADLTAIKYTVYALDSWKGSRTPVPGHDSVSVSLENFLETGTETDTETGLEFNFSLNISAKENPPFPNVGTEYELEVILYDISEEPHADYVRCYCTTNF